MDSKIFIRARFSGHKILTEEDSIESGILLAPEKTPLAVILRQKDILKAFEIHNQLLAKSGSVLIIKDYEPDIVKCLFSHYHIDAYSLGKERFLIGCPFQKCPSVAPFPSHIAFAILKNPVELHDPDKKEASISVAPDITNKIQQQNKRTLLWAMNVCWRGGTALFVLDAIKSMGSFWHHKIVYLSNHQEDRELIQEFQEAGVDISYTPHITKSLVESISPSAVLLSNTDPNKLDGKHPWSWLTHNYQTIYIHHSSVYPWIPDVDTEVFVSQFLYSKYSNLKDVLKNPVIIPPGIQTRKYASIPRLNQWKDEVVIGCLSSNHPDKHPKEILDIVHALAERCSTKIKLKIIGGSSFYKSVENLNYQLELLPFTKSVVDCYKSFDIFLYKSNVPDTWGRNVSEAMASGLPVVTYDGGAMREQIDSGSNGFICKNDKDYIDYLYELVHNPSLRLETGLNARVKALIDFDILDFSRYMDSVLVRNVL